MADTEHNHIDKDISRDEELAEQRRLAGEYAPAYDGILVSQKLSTELIYKEYATGDRAFQVKTSNLSKDFGFFRKIRGDGNCGFRAFYFGLLEVLIELGDEKLLKAQKTRFDEVNKLLVRSGVDSIIWEDWVEATNRLMDLLISTKHREERLEALFTAFNNEDDMSDEHSRELLTHLRVRLSFYSIWHTNSWQFLISYHIKENSEQYKHFVPDGSIDAYCSSLETVSAEMDEVSLTAAHNMLSSAAGISIEVLYLDRSIGESVTRHKWDPEKDQARGVITMLFRP